MRQKKRTPKRRRFTKKMGDQTPAHETLREQRLRNLLRYSECVTHAAWGLSCPRNLENVLFFSGKTVEQFHSDVSETKRLGSLPPFLRPGNGSNQ